MATVRTMLFVFLFFFFNASLAYPHKGKTDAEGCHTDKKKKEYHCHQGKFAGQHFKSRDEMLRKARQERHKKQR
jgi:hypothetical protein